MQKIEYFDHKKSIALYQNYKLHRVSSNTDGTTRFRCQTCKSVSITVNQSDLISRSPNETAKHTNICKMLFPIQSICLQKYESMKLQARTDPAFSFSKSYADSIQELQAKYDPRLVAQYFPKEEIAHVNILVQKIKTK